MAHHAITGIEKPSRKKGIPMITAIRNRISVAIPVQSPMDIANEVVIRVANIAQSDLDWGMSNEEASRTIWRRNRVVSGVHNVSLGPMAW
jgi:hypothetical protein